MLEQKLPLVFHFGYLRTHDPKNIDGIDYHFLTPEAFQEKIEENAFVEYEEVYPGKFYGTLHSELESKWSDGQPLFLISM